MRYISTHSTGKICSASRLGIVPSVAGGTSPTVPFAPHGFRSANGSVFFLFLLQFFCSTSCDVGFYLFSAACRSAVVIAALWITWAAEEGSVALCDGVGSIRRKSRM